MNIKPLISIIVPIYGVELYLVRCVDSLLSQTYQNLQIILVDDGSIDNCPKICDEYLEKDDRINVIHKTNGGLSDARNFGLEIVNGDYILFVDADDYLEINGIENLVTVLNDGNDIIDIVVGIAKEINGEKVSYQQHSNLKIGNIYSSKEYILNSIEKNEFYAPVWLNLYRTDFFKNFRFTKDLIYEDLDLTPFVFLNAKKIVYSGTYFYNYVIRENSIMTNTKKEKSYKSCSFIINKWYRLFSDIKDEELRKYLFGWLSNIYLTMFGKYEFETEFLPDGFKRTKLIKYSNNIICFFKAILYLISPKLYLNLYRKKER